MAAVDNTVVVSSPSFLTAYDTSDGNRIWAHETSLGNLSVYGLKRCFKVYGNSVFEPVDDADKQGRFFIKELNLRTGKKKRAYEFWTIESLGDGYLLGNPGASWYYDFDVSDKYLVVVARDGSVKAIDRVSGKALWEQKHLHGTVVSTYAVIANDLVFVNGSKITAVELRSGRILWERDIESFQLLYVASDLLIANSQHEDGNPQSQDALWALDTKTGRDVWVNKSGLDAMSYATYKGRLVLFGVDSTNRFILTCIDLDTGKESWSYKPGGYWEEQENPIRVPVVIDGVVYFNCYDRYLYALDIDTGKQIDMYLFESGAVLAADAQYLYANDTHYLYKFKKIQKPQQKTKQ